MDILIRIKRDDPPTGVVLPLAAGVRAQLAHGSGESFVGWLGLLRVLANVLGEPRSRPDG